MVLVASAGSPTSGSVTTTPVPVGHGRSDVASTSPRRLAPQPPDQNATRVPAGAQSVMATRGFAALDGDGGEKGLPLR